MKKTDIYLVLSSKIIVGSKKKHTMAFLPVKVDHTVEQTIQTELSLLYPFQEKVSTNYIPLVYHKSVGEEQMVLTNLLLYILT